MVLSPRAVEIIRTLYDRHRDLARGDDDQRRQLTQRIAEQIRFELGPGWGTKKAGAGNPPSKDSLAFVQDETNAHAPMDIWDWQNGSTREPQVADHMPPSFSNVTDQVFIRVTPVNHLAVTSPGPVDLQAAKLVNAPDVKAWPATTAITSLSFGEKGQTRVEFTKRRGPGKWPDIIPAGWDGPLQFTLWLFLQIDGQWVGSAFIQFWQDREGSGDHDPPDVPSVYHTNWYYGDRWTPMEQHGPIRPGELIGFMVTSGNARDKAGPMSVQERSNIVCIPATDTGTFTFDGSVPVEPPVDPPVDPPVPPTPGLPGPQGPPGLPGPAYNDAAILARLALLEEVVKKIPTGCSCSARVFGVNVPISCTLKTS